MYSICYREFEGIRGIRMRGNSRDYIFSPERDGICLSS